MRNLVSAILIVALFAIGLILVVGLPEQKPAPNSTPGEKAVISGKNLIDDVQSFFQNFEKFTYNVEKLITSDGEGNSATSTNSTTSANSTEPSFILTFLGMLKFFGLLTLLGIPPVTIGIVSKSRR